MKRAAQAPRFTRSNAWSLCNGCIDVVPNDPITEVTVIVPAATGDDCDWRSISYNGSRSDQAAVGEAFCQTDGNVTVAEVDCGGAPFDTVWMEIAVTISAGTAMEVRVIFRATNDAGTITGVRSHVFDHSISDCNCRGAHVLSWDRNSGVGAGCYIEDASTKTVTLII